ncbi:hypothetical protein [Curtobacterium sp. 458]|uniref:hypothetical protein n=1 Tax=Curtobacterium sp. 458 TaxID=3050069 RepID=UPI0025B53174|nr:hypothetical protein [Curtobacterium sp. 458]WJY00842.1 hypothetical protein QPJ90_03875 [Curtobacterium sp. 458]
MVASSRAEAAEELEDVYRRIAGLHRETFQPAQRRVEPPPAPVHEADVLKRQQKEKLEGISFFARARRRAALAQANLDTQQEVEHRRRENARQQLERQRQHDQEWSLLNANDPGTVIGALAAAFEDNDAAAAPLGVSGDEASVLVIVPTLAGMPQKKPDVTPTGRPTIKALPKKEASAWHATAVAGCILVTVREAFAVAPGLRTVRMVAATTPERDAYGNRRPEALVAARFERHRLEGVQWETTESVRILNDVATELQLKQAGAAKTLTPLTLDDEPELRALLNAIDYEELRA